MKKPKTIKSIEDLVPDPQNANLGTDRGRAMIKASLERGGGGRGVVADRRGALIAGNKTIEQARELGMPIRVVETDGSELVVIQRKDLDLATDARARELAVADNRSGELDLLWDPDVLRDLEGVDLSRFFRDDELRAVGALGDPPDVDFKEYGEDAADDVAMITCPHCGKDFPR